MRDEVGAAIVMTAILALAMGAVTSTAGAEEASTKVQSQNDASKFSYLPLYCSPDHETHFADLTAELAEQNFAPPAAPIYIGGNQPSSSVFFAGFGPHWGTADLVNHLYHPTPAIQFLAVAQGVFSITAIWVDETPIAIVWDEPMEGVGRPWFGSIAVQHLGTLS